MATSQNKENGLTIEILTNRAMDSAISSAVFYAKELNLSQEQALGMVKKQSCFGGKAWEQITAAVHKELTSC